MRRFRYGTGGGGGFYIGDARWWLFFEPRDIWVGLFISKTNGCGLSRQRILYFLPLPMIGLAVVVEWLICAACGKKRTPWHENRGCYEQCG